MGRSQFREWLKSLCDSGVAIGFFSGGQDPQRVDVVTGLGVVAGGGVPQFTSFPTVVTIPHCT